MIFPSASSGFNFPQKNTVEWGKGSVDLREMKCRSGETSTRALKRTTPLGKTQELTLELKILSEIDNYYSWLMEYPLSREFCDYCQEENIPELALILARLSECQINLQEQGETESNEIVPDTDQCLSVRFEEAMLHGDIRVQVTVGKESIVLRHAATLKDFKTHIAQSMKLILLEPNLTQIKRENIVNEKPAKGGRMSLVSEITYQNGAIWFFKPIKNNTINQEIRINAAVMYGILPYENRFAQRSMFVYQMSEILGFHVIPPVMLSENGAGEPGYIQEKAPGYCGIDWLDHLHNCGKLDTLLANSDIVRQMIELQLLDALTGECDRHASNYFIDLETNKVSGIDNDASGGFLVTHPHTAITRYREDGYRPGSLNAYEQKTVDYIKSLRVIEPISLIKHAVSCSMGVFLPSVMDWNMVAKFKNLDVNRLLESMSLFEFNKSEKDAALSRLAAIRSHIDVLEQRLEREQRLGCPERSIIQPHEWGEVTTTHRLMPQEKHVGNALLACASYLERDAKLVADKMVEYQEPNWVLEVRETGFPGDARILPQKVKWKLFQWHNPFSK